MIVMRGPLSATIDDLREFQSAPGRVQTLFSLYLAANQLAGKEELGERSTTPRSPCSFALAQSVYLRYIERLFAAPTLLLLQMLLLSLKEVESSPLYTTPDTASITLDIFRRQNLWQSTVFVCDQTNGVQMLRFLGKNLLTSVISNDESDLERKLQSSSRARLGVVALLSNNCAKKSAGAQLLTTQTFQNHRNSTYRWLVFSDSLKSIHSDFYQTTVRLDTSLTVVVPDERHPLSRNIFDFYSKNENFLSDHQVGLWQNRSMKNWLDAENAAHRKNMHKQHILFGITVTRQKSWDNSKMMDVLELPPGDSNLPDEDCQLMPYYVLRITSEMFNYTLVRVNGYKSPGYPHPNGTYSDLLGAIQNGEVNCSGSNFIVVSHRQKVVRFLGLCWYFRNTLVYTSSNTFSTPTALIKPFSAGIWILIGIYVVLCSAMMTLLVIFDFRITRNPQEISVSKSYLIVLGSLSGQGEPTNVSSTSFSVLLLTTLFFGVVLSCAYSAEIVQFLLAEPFPTFPKFNDLMQSSLKVAAHDFFYYRKTVFGPNKLEEYRKIYDAKMLPPGGYKALHPAVDGLFKGQWAHLLPEPILYPVLKTATPQQRCRIFEIPDIPKLEKPLCTMIHKDSPAINMFNRGLTLLRERGFYSRYARLWVGSKPRCEEGGARQWSAVDLKVLYPAIGLVCGGLVTSNLLLLVEILHHRWKGQGTGNFLRTFHSCLPFDLAIDNNV